MPRSISIVRLFCDSSVTSQFHKKKIPWKILLWYWCPFLVLSVPVPVEQGMNNTYNITGCWFWWVACAETEDVQDQTWSLRWNLPTGDALLSCIKDQGFYVSLTCKIKSKAYGGNCPHVPIVRSTDRNMFLETEVWGIAKHLFRNMRTLAPFMTKGTSLSLSRLVITGRSSCFVSCKSIIDVDVELYNRWSSAYLQMLIAWTRRGTNTGGIISRWVKNKNEKQSQGPEVAIYSCVHLIAVARTTIPWWRPKIYWLLSRYVNKLTSCSLIWFMLVVTQLTVNGSLPRVWSTAKWTSKESSTRPITDAMS